MLLEQKRLLIETGQQELQKVVFPNKLLENLYI